jgi:hypothetical protein
VIRNVLKGAEAECKALKDEFKARGLLTTVGEHFTVMRSDQVSSRLDVAAVKAFLGDAWRLMISPSFTITAPNGPLPKRLLQGAAISQKRFL